MRRNKKEEPQQHATALLTNIHLHATPICYSQWHPYFNAEI